MAYGSLIAVLRDPTFSLHLHPDAGIPRCFGMRHARNASSTFAHLAYQRTNLANDGASQVTLPTRFSVPGVRLISFRGNPG